MSVNNFKCKWCGKDTSAQNTLYIISEEVCICNSCNSEYIDDLLEKLEPFNDPYFKGLSNFHIAELAKKSIRLTKENVELTDKLELLTRENTWEDS